MEGDKSPRIAVCVAFQRIRCLVNCLSRITGLVASKSRDNVGASELQRVAGGSTPYTQDTRQSMQRSLVHTTLDYSKIYRNGRGIDDKAKEMQVAGALLVPGRIRRSSAASVNTCTCTGVLACDIFYGILE